MKRSARLGILVIASAMLFHPAIAATVAIGAGSYTENFNGIATTALAGWDGRTGASGTSLGTTQSITTSATSWADTGGSFKNVSAADIASSSSSTTQAANANRAFGIRQSGSFGDAGAAFSFNFSTAGVEVTSISIDLAMLSVQPRSTTWTLQYGLGATPGSFVTLATWTDPGAFGSTTFTFDNDDFGTALDEQAQAWFRVVALSGSSGSGARDTVAIDNFSITAVTSVPEPAGVLLGALGLLGVMRRRR